MELLIVISIIVVLVALGGMGAVKIMDKAKRVSAQTAATQLLTASTDYFEEYSTLPLGQNYQSDAEVRTDNDLMELILGLEGGSDENFKKISFFNYQNAKGREKNAYDGIYRTNNRALLLGPWTNPEQDDRFYRVVYNYDYDNDRKIREPQAIGGQDVFGNHALIYHVGKDSRVGPKHNRDNVYSWNKSE